jgi:hypothetical protein
MNSISYTSFMSLDTTVGKAVSYSHNIRVHVSCCVILYLFMPSFARRFYVKCSIVFFMLNCVLVSSRMLSSVNVD